MGYKILGMAVWKGGVWYVRRYGPSRRVVALGVVAAAIAVLVAAGARHESS